MRRCVVSCDSVKVWVFVYIRYVFVYSVFVYSVGVYSVYIVYAVCVGVWVCCQVSGCPPISRVAGSSLPPS